jgi:hypothetical protein
MTRVSATGAYRVATEDAEGVGVRHSHPYFYLDNVIVSRNIKNMSMSMKELQQQRMEKEEEFRDSYINISMIYHELISMYIMKLLYRSMEALRRQRMEKMEELYDNHIIVSLVYHVLVSMYIMNLLYRSMEELHQQRMEKMEELYDHHILTIKRTIEQKLRQNLDNLGQYSIRIFSSIKWVQKMNFRHA